MTCYTPIKVTSKYLKFLSIIIVNSIITRRISTESATEWIHRLDNSGVPVLLCLTHADKFYANECIAVHGRDCDDETAKRVIGREIEVYIFT